MYIYLVPLLSCCIDLRMLVSMFMVLHQQLGCPILYETNDIFELQQPWGHGLLGRAQLWPLLQQPWGHG